MNFGLSKKYSEIDFEVVSLSDLVLIGGGCGEGGGGGGSTTVASVQQAQQTAASQPGANLSAYANISSPSASGNINIQFGWSQANGVTVTGTAQAQGSTGHVTAGASVGATFSGWWSSVTSFFSGLFGSH